MYATESKQAFARRQTQSHRVNGRKLFRQAGIHKSAPSELVIDSRGIITDCSDDLLLAMGASKEQIVGNNVRSHIPALPFQADTEGYNIAYATFLAAQNVFRTWLLNTIDGSGIEAKGCIALQRSPAGYAIRLTIESSLSDARMLSREIGSLPPAPVRMTHAALSPAADTSSQWLRRPHCRN